ncbi:hypothetical protein [Halosimplex halobium]|uniref:hypothetical protein n=1 Tax=Halosimplex halobium TaxID=3396618 RepID=UPI003F547613
MKYLISVAVVASLVLIAGCLTNGSGGGVGITGNITATGEGFYLNGTVEHTGMTDPTFEDVSVYLYTANGSVIRSEYLGTMDETGLEVRLRASQIPKYVIVDSPDIWADSGIGAYYYEYVEDSQAPNGIYAERGAGSREEFPVTVPPNTSTPA